MTPEYVLVMCLCTVLINLAILGLTMKLYTEYFKDRAITRRGDS